MLSELVLPAFAALWFGIRGSHGRYFILDVPHDGHHYPIGDVDYLVGTVYLGVV